MMDNVIQAIERLNKIKPNNRPSEEGIDYNVLDHLIFQPKITDDTPSSRVNKAFRDYRKIVRQLTELVAHLIPDIDLRGFKNHHIDHKVSIWYGFHHGIPPEQIAEVANLRLIPYKDNMLKGVKSIFEKT